MKSKLFILGLSALSFGACQTDNPSGFESDPQAVRITASTNGLLTRLDPTGNGTTFVKDDEILVSANTQLPVKYRLDNDDNGNWIPETNKYLKWESSSMSFTAVYPSDATDMAFNLPDDQLTKLNLAKADYMTFKGTCSQGADNSVSLNLAHRTARVKVVITKFELPYNNESSKVHEVKITSPADKYLAGVASGGLLPIKAFYDSSTGGGVGGLNSTYTALIIPTTAAKNDVVFISLKDDAGTELTFKNIPALQANFSYTYNVTVSSSGIVINSVTIEEWKPGAAINPGGTESSFIDYVYISPIPFMMGTLDEMDPNNIYPAEEKPAHTVNLNSFYMSKYEITNAQYCLFLNANYIGEKGTWDGPGEDYSDQILIFSSSEEDAFNWGVNYTNGKWVPAEGKADYPVIYVTWYGATAFADWVGAKLPTEAQWEYACRATIKGLWATPDGTETKFGDYAWFGEKVETGSTHPIGKKLPNNFGLYDMAGNVSEWCYDLYDAAYYSSPTETWVNPTGPTTAPKPNNPYHVVRGGCWASDASDCRSAYRGNNDYDPAGNNGGLGFRVVVSVLP